MDASGVGGGGPGPGAVLMRNASLGLGLGLNFPTQASKLPVFFAPGCALYRFSRIWCLTLAHRSLYFSSLMCLHFIEQEELHTAPQNAGYKSLHASSGLHPGGKANSFSRIGMSERDIHFPTR